MKLSDTIEKSINISVMGKDIVFFPKSNYMSVDWLGYSQPKYYPLIFDAQKIINGILCVDHHSFNRICRDYFGDNFENFYGEFFIQIYTKKYN